MESYLWKPDDLDEIAAVLSPARREAVAQAEAEAVTDWPGIIGPVAEALLGEPTKRARDEWRYRTRGSLAVHVSGERAGTWRDWEADTGGGVLALVEHERGCDKAAALDWLESAGFVESRDRERPVRRTPRTSPLLSTPEPADTGPDPRAALVAQLWARAVPGTKPSLPAAVSG